MRQGRARRTCEIHTQFLLMPSNERQWFRGLREMLRLIQLYDIRVVVLILMTQNSSAAGQPLWSSGESSWLHNGDVLCLL
jgi:hypothetical protein